MRKMLLIIPAIVLLSGGATFALSSKKEPEPVRAVGEPKNCVTISQIRSTKVIDSSNIDFHMVGGKNVGVHIALEAVELQRGYIHDDGVKFSRCQQPNQLAAGVNLAYERYVLVLFAEILYACLYVEVHEGRH